MHADEHGAGRDEVGGDAVVAEHVVVAEHGVVFAEGHDVDGCHLDDEVEVGHDVHCHEDDGGSAFDANGDLD